MVALVHCMTGHDTLRDLCAHALDCTCTKFHTKEAGDNFLFSHHGAGSSVYLSARQPRKHFCIVPTHCHFWKSWGRVAKTADSCVHK